MKYLLSNEPRDTQSTCVLSHFWGSTISIMLVGTGSRDHWYLRRDNWYLRRNRTWHAEGVSYVGPVSWNFVILGASVNLEIPSITLFTVVTWRISGSHGFLDVNIAHNARGSQWLARKREYDYVHGLWPPFLAIFWVKVINALHAHAQLRARLSNKLTFFNRKALQMRI